MFVCVGACMFVYKLRVEFCTFYCNKAAKVALSFNKRPITGTSLFVISFFFDFWD